MENIRYGRLDATDEEVIAAAKAAHADHFIRTLPGGYQMELNEDASNVMPGPEAAVDHCPQRFWRTDRVLILDEATAPASIPAPSMRIQTAMDRLMQGPHQLCHCPPPVHHPRRRSDSVSCSDGDIVEQGTHDELIDQGGFYADLYNSQFEDVTA